MSRKTRNLANKAGKLMKCDGQMLKKVIEAKGYKCHELSKMLRYCSDYLTTCCRTNKISDVAAKYLMDYKIFPQMYDLEGEIKVDEPKEVKIDKDESSDEAKLDKLKKRMDLINRNAIYGIPKETAQETRDRINEAKEILNRRYGARNSYPGDCYMNASRQISAGLYHLMHAAINDLKNDPEFKELIKQAVKEAYEEL